MKLEGFHRLFMAIDPSRAGNVVTRGKPGRRRRTALAPASHHRGERRSRG